MTTKYPGAIDGYAEIRVARNRIDEIVAEDHNDCRSAIIAVEQTLGINPQGPFGTIKARMDDAYQNIESHVLGNPPRHQDTVIESPARSGTYHSLTQGTVGSQIIELLADVNSLNFAGTNSYADGTGISATKIRDAINEIVGDIGDSTTPNHTGGYKVGVSNFTPGSSGQYVFSGTNVATQTQEAGDFIEEARIFRARAFDAFVAEGKQVVNHFASGPYDIEVDQGYVACNGKLVYSPGELMSPTPGITQYIYATVSGGNIVVATTDDPAVATANQLETTVLLAIIEDNGSSWDITDIRRFGMFTNNKHGFTVGNDIDGETGYAYDFESISAAVNYINLLNLGGKKHAPQKITIATDIEETVTSEISPNLVGLEIDGGGHIITLLNDISLFEINANYVHVHDVKVLSAAASAANSAFATIATIGDLSGIVVSDCSMSSDPSFGVPYPAYFLRIGEAAGAFTLSYSQITNNVAKVRESAISLVKPEATVASIINDSVISDNIFMNMQTSFGISSESCIRVGSNCVVSNNVIQVNTELAPFNGAFIRGIEIEYGESCVITNNFINGGTGTMAVSGNALMEIGILVRWAAGSIRSIISDNIIKGTNLKGIDCNSITGVLIANNYLTNKQDFDSGFSGIVCSSDPSYVIGNVIESPGLVGISQATHVMNNIIYGSVTHPGLAVAIDVATSGVNKIINGNLIFECSGAGIECNQVTYSAISDNILIGQAFSGSGIVNMGSYCNIANNIISDYPDSGILTAGTSNGLVISGNSIFDTVDFGISLDISESCIITNNYLQGNGGKAAIYDCSSFSIVANNWITDYGMGGYYAIQMPSGPVNNVIVAHNIIIELSGSAQGALEIPLGSSDVSIIGNFVTLSPGIGINLSISQGALCSNNILYGNGTTSTLGISSIGSRSMILGNMVHNYCPGSEVAIGGGGDGVIISDNIINDCNGTGINMGGGVWLLIANNLLYGGSSSEDGIVGVGEYSIVSDNVILNYGAIAGSTGIKTNTSSGKISIIGNAIWPLSNMDVGIDLAGPTSNYYLVANNVIGNEWGGVGKIGININGSSRTFVLNNVIAGSNTGTSGDDCIKSVGGWCMISNNYITDANYNGITIVGDQNVVSNNRINNVSNDGIYLQLGVNGNLINSNLIYWSTMGGRFGIYGESALYNSLCGNYISQSANVGIFFEDSSHTLVNGNWVGSTGNRGIYLYGCPHSNIVGNLVRNSDVEGIEIFSSNFSQIASNQVTDAGTTAIRSTADHAHIVGNYIYNSGSNAISCINATGGSMVGNLAWDVGGIGISTTSLLQYSVIGNMIINHTNTAYNFTGTSDFLASGNCNFGPGTASNVHGMDLTSTTGALIVGNRCIGGTGTGSVAFAGVTTNNTMSGNLAVDLSGAITAIFASGHAVPTSTNRRL